MNTVDSPLAAGTVGQQFAAACAKDGTKAAISLQATVSDLFPGFKKRPRLAVRNLFKVVQTDQDQAKFWYETHPQGERDSSIIDVELRPEAAFEFHYGRAPLRPVRAWVQPPPAILDDPEALATFIDYRLLVRLGTAENQALTIGRGGEGPLGLLHMSEIRRLPAEADPRSSILFACDHVELMGGSADGIVMNTTDYYRYLVGRESLLRDLDALGIRIARTRMMPAGTLVVGDFFAGATVFDSGRSTVRFAEPPPGIFARPGLAVCAEISECLTLHLPTHFFVASLVG